MNVLLISRSDGEGGAGQAAYRLYRGLRINGVKATLRVQKALRGDPDVIAPTSRVRRMLALLWPHLDQAPLLCYPRRTPTPWSVGWAPSGTASWVNARSPDLVHMHWINGGILSIRGIGRFRCPAVWTLHDSWAFTGGCHCPYECRGYEGGCGKCPQLGSRFERDLSRVLYRSRLRHWRGRDLTLISPSRWLAEKARQGPLFRTTRIEVIPNGIDTSVFKPVDKRFARQLLNLPETGRLVLFGALNAVKDRNKGFDRMCKAVDELGGGAPGGPSGLVVFGSSAADGRLPLPAGTRFLGTLRDEALMAAAYSAADVFVLPSLSENLPYTVMEAMACGTPCVGFDVGGVPELIGHGRTGYVAREGDAGDLAEGIKFVLGDENARRGMSANAREDACQKYALGEVARRHADLYREILERGRQHPARPKPGLFP